MPKRDPCLDPWYITTVFVAWGLGVLTCVGGLLLLAWLFDSPVW